MSAEVEPRLPVNQYAGWENLNGAIITDCGDDNARVRQETKFKQLFGTLPSFRGLGEYHPDLQAAGNLVDVLSAGAPVGNYPTSPQVILVNVAPRGDDVRRRHKNGTPFCHAQVGDAHIFSTYEGRALSLVNLLRLARTVEVFDIPTVSRHLVQKGTIAPDEAEEFTKTQFRSLEVLPHIAYEALTGENLPFQRERIELHPEVWGSAYETDNFGNIKIAATADSVGFENGGHLKVLGAGAVRCVEHLTDVPQDGELALTVGSSGFRDSHFLELVVQRGHATQKLSELRDEPVAVGHKILDVA